MIRIARGRAEMIWRGECARELNAAVNGPEAIVLSSEDDPNAATISAELDAGDYSIDLQDGWVLERLDGTAFVQVDSMLISPDPTTFHISANAPTSA